MSGYLLGSVLAQFVKDSDEVICPARKRYTNFTPSTGGACDAILGHDEVLISIGLAPSTKT